MAAVVALAREPKGLGEGKPLQMAFKKASTSAWWPLPGNCSRRHLASARGFPAMKSFITKCCLPPDISTRF